MFIKLLNDDLIHNSITYKEGKWFTDPKFDETIEFGNGLHFCEISQIEEWLNLFGSKICIVELAPDSKVVKFDDKYKTDKLKIVSIDHIWDHPLFDEIVKINPYNLCLLLAKYGQLKALRYAHENGCELGIDICLNAAYYGQLDCLKYAHEQMCHWDAYTCSDALQNGHVECLEYAVINKCPGYEEYIDKLQKLKMKKNTN